jgi:hypothetical protein
MMQIQKIKQTKNTNSKRKNLIIMLRMHKQQTIVGVYNGDNVSFLLYC